MVVTSTLLFSAGVTGLPLCAWGVSARGHGLLCHAAGAWGAVPSGVLLEGGPLLVGVLGAGLGGRTTHVTLTT